MNETITGFLEERVADGAFPSAVYLVAEKGTVVFQDAVGMAVIEPEPTPARIETIYDLASLTKVLSTGLLAAMSIETGEVLVSDSVSRFFGWAGQSSDSITIQQLFTHTSGFEAWRPFYLFAPPGLAKSEIAENVLGQIRSSDLRAKPGTKVIYSDLNFILLGAIVEKIFGQTLGDLFESRIAGPLGLMSTFCARTGSHRGQTAASENGNLYEENTCREMFPEMEIPTSAFRKGVIWGEVHDGNAFFMGGMAGHAGLFSTVSDVFRIASQFLGGSTELLNRETCELFETNFTPGLEEDRGVAFQLASTAGSTAGDAMLPQSFGHTGFTGTSLWIDPLRERIFVLLTNRTHHHPLPFVNINSIRRNFHNLASAALDRG